MIGHRTPEFQDLFNEVLDLLAELHQTKTRNICLLTASGTGAVEAMILNALRPDDKLLVLNTGLFAERLAESARRAGVQVKMLDIGYGKLPDEDLYISSLEKFKPHAVAIVYNETSTGTCIRTLPKLASIAKDHNAIVLVDAVSALGGEEIRMDEWRIDAVASASQKCLATPPGLSFLALSEELTSIIKSRKPRSFYFDANLYMKFLSERSETPFTPAVTLLYSLLLSLRTIVKGIGLDKWIALHKARANALYSALSLLGLDCFAEPQARSHTVTVFKVPSGSDNSIVKYVRSKWGIDIAKGAGPTKGSCIRIGCMGALKPYHIRYTIVAIYDALRTLGLNIRASLDEALDAADKELATIEQH